MNLNRGYLKFSSNGMDDVVKYAGLIQGIASYWLWICQFLA